MLTHDAGTYDVWLGKDSYRDRGGRIRNALARKEKFNRVIRTTRTLARGLEGFQEGNNERISNSNPLGVSNRDCGPYIMIITEADVVKYYGSDEKLHDRLKENEEYANL